jgi:chorismate mutase/prephenate dehydratase
LAQKKNELRVGYQGSEGAYSELAAKKHFVGTAKPLRCIGYHSFRQMLEALKAGELDYAVLPIENSIAGSINESYDLLAKMGLSLVGEEFQPIAHCLIGAADVAVTEIRRVYSHPVALARRQSRASKPLRCTACRSYAGTSPTSRRTTRGW